MINDVQFEFLGFNPDERVKEFVSNIADRLHLSAPSDSGLKLVIEKSKDAIRASCLIASQAGVFVADAVSDSPIQALRQIEAKISRQLDRWKKHRFESTGPISLAGAI